MRSQLYIDAALNLAAGHAISARIALERGDRDLQKQHEEAAARYEREADLGMQANEAIKLPGPVAG
jgi:hypothetical protein